MHPHVQLPPQVDSVRRFASGRHCQLGFTCALENSKGKALQAGKPLKDHINAGGIVLGWFSYRMFFRLPMWLNI